jgi:hypothetical protein
MGPGLVRKDGKVAGSTDGNAMQGNVNEIVICSRHSSIVLRNRSLYGRFIRVGYYECATALPRGRDSSERVHATDYASCRVTVRFSPNPPLQAQLAAA